MRKNYKAKIMKVLAGVGVVGLATALFLRKNKAKKSVKKKGKRKIKQKITKKRAA